MESEESKMENKIVEVNSVDCDYQCIVCCKQHATTRIRIKRLAYEDNIASFFVCDECLAKMQNDVKKICK